MLKENSVSLDAIHFKGDVCFKEEWSGFDEIRPLNVIIGRNNSGKSRLLGLVEALCQKRLEQRGWQLRRRCRLDEASLARTFQPSTSGGVLRGQHWHDHGRFFVGIEVVWETSPDGRISVLTFPDGFDETSQFGDRSTKARHSAIGGIVREKLHLLSGRSFRRLLADRDIRTEEPRVDLALEPSGEGASNIVRRFLVSSDEKLPREVVQEELLESLNRIIGTDGCFNEIYVQEHDSSGSPKPHWEIYLGEETKGLVPLTNSGSGLKTVILVLLNLLVVPRVENRPRSEYVFAFEELENNLHPAVLRRLFLYLEEYAIENESPVFLTTHSSVAVDFFGTSEHAQIVHVSHDGESARTATVSGHFDHLRVVSELGVRPSDLLQANGVVWVEGPSDRVYLNRWIELVAGGLLREGRDYQCAFYGGALLARNQFRAAEDADTGLANLFQINPNVVVVCDSDRSSRRAGLKERVKRIKKEVRELPNAHVWITGTREIENYLTGQVLAAGLEKQDLPDPEQWESFYPRQRVPSSYWEREVGRSSVDKVDLAVACSRHMSLEVMAGRFDWQAQVTRIVDCIRGWSS